MNKEWDKIHISVQKFHNDILKLAQFIPKDKYRTIVGIPRGGYIIAVYLSHRFNLPWMDYNFFTRYLNYVEKETVLIVDDIADTGKTLYKLKGIDCATLYYKPRSIIKPTYYVGEFKNSEWVEFPYEISNEIPNREVG